MVGSNQIRLVLLTVSAIHSQVQSLQSPVQKVKRYPLHCFLFCCFPASGECLIRFVFCSMILILCYDEMLLKFYYRLTTLGGPSKSIFGKTWAFGPTRGEGGV